MKKYRLKQDMLIIQDTTKQETWEVTIDELLNMLRREQNAIQECYLQCLAVECGEGECAEAIATKFPEYVSRYEEVEDKLSPPLDHQALREESLYSRNLINWNGCINKQRGTFRFYVEVPERYFDAWMELLNNN